jgi:hypothetical protein
MSYTNTYASVLKLHAAGYLYFSSGKLNGRGSYGHYWSSMLSSAGYGWFLVFYSNYSGMTIDDVAFGFSLRCLRD